MNSLVWRKINHIDDVKPIGNDDLPCLNEILEVLKKHNCVDRFGVALLHKHFDLQEGEILLESTDVERREQWIRPVQEKHLKSSGVEAQATLISYSESKLSVACVCARTPAGHTGYHVSTPSTE